MTKKEEIIQTAAILFTKRGYYGVGLKELLDQCNVPKGSFYYYFPKGKIDLLKQVLDYCYERMINGIRKNYFNKETVLECFEAMADGLAEHLNDSNQFVSLTLSMIGIESVYLDEEIHEKCKEIYTSWQQMYSDLFIEHGYSIKEAQMKAQSIFSLIHGSLISSWIKSDNTDLYLVKKALKDFL